MEIKQYRNIDDLEIGFFKYEAHAFPMHFHHQFAFALVESGRGDFQIGKTDFKAGQGYFTIIHPHEAHTTKIEREYGLEYKTLYLPPEMICQLLQESNDQLHFSERLLKNKEISASFSAIHAVLSCTMDQLELESTLLTLIHHLYKFSTHSPKENRLGRHSLRHAIEYMQDNFAEKITLVDLAREVFLSPSHFLRLFKKQMGISPMQYLTSVRINQAKKMLSQGYPIKEIAYQTGFYDCSHLNKYFKAITGFPPQVFQGCS